jgi:hypothetical protein
MLFIKHQQHIEVFDCVHTQKDLNIAHSVLIMLGVPDPNSIILIITSVIKCIDSDDFALPLDNLSLPILVEVICRPDVGLAHRAIMKPFVPSQSCINLFFMLDE